MATSKLNKTQLQFTDASSNVGQLAFANDAFSVDKSVAFSGGIVCSSVGVSSGSLTVAPMTDVKIAGATTGELTIKANDSTTDHTIKFPATQGSTDTVLTNDGSGNLSWATASGGSSGSLLKFALQGAIKNISASSSFVMPFSSVVSGASSSYGKVNKVSYDPDGILSNNVFTVNSSGWWHINIFIHHTEQNLDSTGGQNGLGTSEFRIRFNGATTTYGEFMNSPDSETGSNETCCYSAVVNLNTNDYFDVVMLNTTTQTNEDFIVRVGLMKLNTSTSTDGASDFSGATTSASGQAGLVPQPTAGQHNYLLLGSGSWAKPNGEAMIDLYGTERVYWDKKASPTGVITINGNTTYATQNNNNYLRLVNGNSETGRVYWTDGNNYKNYKLEIWLSLTTGSGPADYYWLWAEGTQTSSGDQTATGGLVVATDTYNSNTHEQANSIDIYNGSGYTSLKSKSSMGVNPFSGNFTKFVLMRYGDEITYYIQTYEGAIGYYRDKVSSSQSLSGTTYGVGAKTGGENMGIYISTFKLTTLD